MTLRLTQKTAVGVAALGLLLCDATFSAALAGVNSCNWSTGSSAEWSASSTWSGCNGTDPNNASGDTYDATISVAGTYTVTLTSPVSIGSLTLVHSQSESEMRGSR